MSLTTICKLEMALDISMMVVPGSYTVLLECNIPASNLSFTKSIKYVASIQTNTVGNNFMIDKDLYEEFDPAI